MHDDPHPVPSEAGVPQRTDSRPTLTDDRESTKAVPESMAETAGAKPLTAVAERALREAAERRAAIDARAAELGRRTETGGRGGLEPVRYADWEIKGRAIDF